MSSEPDSTSTLPTRSSRQALYLVLAAFVLLGGTLYWGLSTQRAPSPEPPPEISTAPPAPVEPEVIVPAEPEPPMPAEVPPEPDFEAEPELPTISLADSDVVLAEQIPQLNGGELGEQFVMQPNRLERGAAIVDNLRQGSVPYKLLPAGRPTKPFPFQDNGLAVTMDPSGFTRYDGLAATIDGLDVSATLALYDLLSPAAEEAWSMLGYSEISFEEAVLGALGMIMMAPTVDPEARLIRDESNWIYEDEALESLPALQKQIMRMGPDNAEKVQDKAREFRGALLDRDL